MELTYENYLAHHGIKGMRWGVRRKPGPDGTVTSKVESKDQSKMADPKGKPGYIERTKSRYSTNRNRDLAEVRLKSKNGEEILLKEDQSPKFVSFVDSLSDKKTKRAESSKSFGVSIGGEKVGEASLNHLGDDEINLEWLGVDPKHRGKGYATSVFDAAVAYGKESGAKKLTLEVPGNAPDARHIYEKKGFLVTKNPTKEELNDIWGGLTHMELDLTKQSVRHSSVDEEDLELDRALRQTFQQPPREVLSEMFGEQQEEGGGGGMEQDGLTYDDYLAHHGIKGMRWGVRRKSGPDGTVGSGSGKVVSKNKSKMAESSSSGGSSEPKKDNSSRNKKIAAGAGIAALAVGAAIGGVAVKNVVDTKRVNAGLEQVRKVSKMSLSELYLETAPPPPKKPTRSNRAAKRDTKLYGDRGSKRIEKAIDKGKSPRAARNRENIRAGAKFAVKAGMNAAMSR